ncbi:hypothetical protein [Okeania sp. SIO2B3]|uniref:hypothetical protein n=1 Tax=Okeania sp. SIO2B3 TaxID=2607784 RepID=UPI0013BFB1C3|nr:hypothetical protein [Okeania sp. SIO2B3]NET47117.1 hypothetical protein [Okeania sp. SIO2B3]
MKDFFKFLFEYVFMFFTGLGAAIVQNFHFLIGLSVIPLIVFSIIELRSENDKTSKLQKISSLCITWFGGVATGVRFSS